MLSFSDIVRHIQKIRILKNVGYANPAPWERSDHHEKRTGTMPILQWTRLFSIAAGWDRKLSGMRGLGCPLGGDVRSCRQSMREVFEKPMKVGFFCAPPKARQAPVSQLTLCFDFDRLEAITGRRLPRSHFCRKRAGGLKAHELAAICGVCCLVCCAWIRDRLYYKHDIAYHLDARHPRLRSGRGRIDLQKHRSRPLGLHHSRRRPDRSGGQRLDDPDTSEKRISDVLTDLESGPYSGSFFLF